MSKRADRWQAQQRDLADGGNEAERARREPPPRASDPNPSAWRSFCAGWRGRFHEKAYIDGDGKWVCRWCWQHLDPPATAAPNG